LAEDGSQRTGVDATHEKQIPQVDKAVHFEEHSGADTNHEEQSKQMPPSKERKISSYVLDAISAVTAYDHLTSQANEEANTIERFEFEMHYGLSSESFTGILHEILLDMSTFQHIHNWDEKLFKGPLKRILKVVHKSWGENRSTLTSLIANSTVEEIRDILSIGTNNAPPATEEAGDVGSYLFFTKVGGCPYHKLRTKCSHNLKRASGKGAPPLSTPQETKIRGDKTGSNATSIEGLNALNLAQGRIV
jgi:hypothetical protein